MLHEQSDERQINKSGDNLYTPMWLPLSKLPEVSFRTKNIQQRLLQGVADGFPTQVQEFSSDIQ
jgi:hypothetical protein